MEVFLQAEGITKSFPGVLANDHVSLDIREGEVHCLLGENGAGKTVFSSILYGLYQPDSGSISVQGQRVRIPSPRQAMSLGIGMVHQHFMLVPVFTVAENVVLGVNPGQRWLKPGEGAGEEINELASEYGFEIDPHALVGQLSVGLKQRVEILKALYRKARLLILDEPTSVLTPQESRQLSVSIGKLVERGLAVLFITHKLNEVMEFSDRVTVMRNGRVVGTCDTADTDEMSLARMMVGRDVVLRVSRPEQALGDVILEVDNLTVLGDQGIPAVTDVSFQLRAGEILGIAGVDGNGQRELAEAIYGLRRVVSGRITFAGTQATGFPPSTLQEIGLRYVAPDRASGLIPRLCVTDNMILEDVGRRPFSRWGLIDWERANDHSEDLIRKFSIRASSVRALMRNLSGGNQQKVLLARATVANPRVLVVSQPTRGLDVGATEYVRLKLLECRSKGTAILLISTDLDEVLSMSDRVAVMFRGTFQGVLDHSRADRETVGAMMAGLQTEHRAPDMPATTPLARGDA